MKNQGLAGISLTGNFPIRDPFLYAGEVPLPRIFLALR
jgi:hypothetical protein